jgi:hypothetical protein
MTDNCTPRRYQAKKSVSAAPEMFTTIEWDWARRAQRWRTHGLYIPVVNQNDERGIVCTLNADAERMNNGWTDTMPVQTVGPIEFVDENDPRNGNPPLELES